MNLNPRAQRRLHLQQTRPGLVAVILERDRLQRFHPALLALTLVFGSLEVAEGVVLRESSLVAASGLTFLFAIGLVIAGRQLRDGRADRARAAVAISLALIGILGTYLIAGLGLAMALLPLLSAILVLPYIVRRQLLPISVAAVATRVQASPTSGT